MDTHCPLLALVPTASCRDHVVRAAPGLPTARGIAPLTRAPLQTHRLKERVAPVLSVLTECARLHRPARKFLKAQVREQPCWGPWWPRWPWRPQWP